MFLKGGDTDLFLSECDRCRSGLNVLTGLFVCVV